MLSILVSLWATIGESSIISEDAYGGASWGVNIPPEISKDGLGPS